MENQTEKNIKQMVPYFWILFKRYLNNPSYFVRQEDVLADLFMKGESDVQEFLEECNKKLLELNSDIKLEYKERLTYKDILNPIVYGKN